MKDNRFKISYVILSIFLICFGGCIAYYIISGMFFDSFQAMTIIYIISYIPTLALMGVFLYSGFSLLVKELKLLAGKSDEEEL